VSGWSIREDGTGESPEAAGLASRPLRAQARGSHAGRPGVLSVRLLGGVSAAWMGRDVPLPTWGARALLAVLAVQQRPRLRESIAGDLWPEAGRSSAARLRQALWHLRRAFATAGAGSRDLFGIDPDRLGFRPDVACDLDVVRFRSLLAARPPDLSGALGLYRGEYAEGLDLECFARDRELLADLFEDALAQLGYRCLRDGDLACARTASLDLLARDPLREEAHATLIEVLGRTGSRDQVVRQYRRLVRLLDRELGIEPLAETQESFRTAMRQTGLRSAGAVARRAISPGTPGEPPLHDAPSGLGPGRWPSQ
jgi:DNA-binding SARP family transcriptional activator